ncbi:hypothetical protein [Xanthomonas campestris]|uniref:Uncharacterized protein n=1 Tax=Xanthomonas campestris pv. papavericola TaxID=487881 RepID=A0AAJ3CFS4_XANCA|nr:hypothetical protein [Xanthomonas campestris]MEC3890101.1 hypothetical protein [Xanthomonas campestris pv. papavericola]
MSTIESILLLTTGNALLLGVLGWLARSLLQNFLTKDLVEHRVRLESESQRSVQAFGHALTLAAREHDIRFGKLHERRADTIAKLYELLIDTSDKGAAYSSPVGHSGDPPKAEQFNDFANSYNEAARYFHRKKLFLPPATCAKVDELFRGLKEQPAKMNIYMNMADQHPGTNFELQRLDAWDAAWKYFHEDFKPAMVALEHDLRALLGDQPANAS